MSLSTLSLYIDNVPATEIAPHSPFVYETWAEGGCGSLSFDFAMSPKRTHHLIYPGALVEGKLGMHPIFSGRLAEFNRATWECVAYGHASHARKLPALDAFGNSTRDVADAIATGRGWGWLADDPFGIGTGVVSGDDTGPIMIAELLDRWAQDAGYRWGVDASRRLYLRPDPATPTFYLAPDVTTLGQAEEGLSSHLGARYINAVGGTTETAIRPPNGQPITSMELIDDLLDRGAMTTAEANATLDGLLARGRGKPMWISGITVHRSQLQSRGVHPFLPTITAGVDMARLFGVPASFVAPGTTLDVAIGKTRFDAAMPDMLYLEPVNTAPRSFSDVVAAA